MRHLIVVSVFFILMTGLFYVLNRFAPSMRVDIQKPAKMDRCDSLQSDLLSTEIELNRYEIALEILKDEDSLAANKFIEILSTQTE